MDGVDLAGCEFTCDGTVWEFRIIAGETLPYPEQLKSKLENASGWSRERIQKLDMELGGYFAQLLNDFHNSHRLTPHLIASHGHTILHEPLRGITLQAGNGDVMAKRTGITVINDFRSEDVTQGGQGAPLVPVGDRLLFSSFEGCLNLGGFGNISFENEGNRRIAYDLCPVNMALNWIAGLEGLEFDQDGRMARQGEVYATILESLNSLSFYNMAAPKSLGREWFLGEFLPIIKSSEVSTSDLMATVVEHIAIQIAGGINRAGIGSVLVTGGGALNQTLIERIGVYTSAQIEIPDLQLVHFKEALVFALLGLLRWREEINVLASVTGGKKDLSAGTIHKN